MNDFPGAFAPTMPARTLVFAGCLNQAVPHFATANGRGIAVYDFDDSTGTLTPLAETRDIVNPTYLAVLPGRKLLYATSEVFGEPEGRVSAYRLDTASGALTRINSQPTRGSLTAYCNTDLRAACVFVANYAHETAEELPGRHVASFAILADGALSPVVSEFAHSGSGPRSDRQSVPHGHCVVPSPDNRHAIATDLGTDELITYRLDATRGSLAECDHPSLKMPAGAGPRHFVFHPNGLAAYVVNELDSTISRLAYLPETGTPSMIETVRGLPEDDPSCAPADLHIAADGRFLYASFRGSDCIATYTLDPAGRIIATALQRTGGKSPRSFTLSPSGAHLLVANQDSDLLECFRLDPVSGCPSTRTDSVSVGTPMCVKAAVFA
jgi:6-phosphogluconolactonase